MNYRYSQLTLFSDIEVLSGAKRKRFQPIWKKFYTVYKFDYKLYHQICFDVANKTVMSRLLFYLQPNQAIFYVTYFAYLHSLTRFDEYKIRKMCFILDNEGCKVHKGDERHIFRIAALQRVYNKLYEYADFSPFATEALVQRIRKTPPSELSFMECSILCKIESFEEKGFRIHFNDKFGHQLEIAGTEMLTVKERLLLHIRLLRKLRKKVRECRRN